VGQRRAHRGVSRLIAAAADSLLSVLLAPSCASCSEQLDRPSRGPVCERCWRAIPAIVPPLCDRCGDPLPSWRTISIPLDLCARCRRTSTYVDRSRAIGEYSGPLRAIVQALKYEGRRSLAAPLAALMRLRGADMLADATWIVPVPLHPSRRRHRGFNQASDLARHLGLPVQDALCRRVATAPQTALPAAQRHRNVRNAFALTAWRRWWPGRQEGRERLMALNGATIVLVDDVSTTGATLNACARILKEGAGVREVRALTAARVVTSPR
jgi:ComF family protein